MAWNDSLELARVRVHRRISSYRAVFLVARGAAGAPPPWWAFWRPRRGGELAPPAEVVLRDLANYCYARRPTLKVSQADQHVDPLAMAFAEGRRDVYLHILTMLNLTADQVERLAQRSAEE
jgi:hypothetical protein